MLSTFAEVEERLATALPGYEPRPQQQRAALAVEGLYSRHLMHDQIRHQPTNLAVQAGCGVGKSLAYLVPAILAAVNSGKRTIVSVTTKALQAQIAGKDMPFLEEHLGVAFTWCVLKGRSNYFCAAIAETAMDAPSVAAILRHAEQHPEWEGTREELPFEVPVAEWSQVASDSDACRDLRCKEAFSDGASGCYAEAARARARSRQIVLANHALFFTDLSLRAQGIPGMLGEYDFVVLDEAHEAESVAGDTLGGRLVQHTFVSLAREVWNWVRAHAPDRQDQVSPVTGRLTMAAGALFGDDGLPVGRIRTATLNENEEVLAGLVDALRELRSQWLEIRLDEVPTVDYKKAKARRDKVTRRIASTFDRVGEMIGDDPEIVRWVELETGQRGDRRKAVRTCPISVAPFLREHLFGKVPTALVSATMAVKGSFDYIAGRLGIDKLVSLDVGTPFDFERQARLYVPTIPAPERRDIARWEAAVDEEIVELVRASRGRALVLFTSLKHMRECAARVGHRIQQALLVQGQNGVSVGELTRRFREETDSVLFGTRSFFTGVDVQGQSLSLVVITKMPFPVPDEPLTQARCEQIVAAGGSDFRDYTIPVMSLTLQQAVGRLIRHRGDTGVAAILDPRMLDKPYGKQIVADLPPMPRTRVLSDVEDFFRPAVAV